MYPAELEIKDTTESITSASYLDLLLLIGRNGQHHASIYDKRDSNFHITNFPFLSSNISSFQAYDVLSLSLFDTPRFAPRINVWFRGPGDFSVSYSNRDTLWNAWNRHSGNFMVDMGSYSTKWSLPPTNVKWHSDPWPVTVTSPPVRLSINFMTLIPNMTFTELRVVTMKRLQGVKHASRARLPFRTPCSVPHFGTCLCSNCWDQFSRTCRVFSRLFTVDTPRHFLDFFYYFNPEILYFAPISLGIIAYRFLRLLYPPPHNEVRGGGVYWNHPVRPSVRPSVRL